MNRYLATTAYKASTFCFSAAVCMSTGDSNVSCRAGMIFIVFALTGLTRNLCFLARPFGVCICAATAF